MIKDTKNTFSFVGNWPDELDSEPLEEPWETFHLGLWGEEAGDIIFEEVDVIRLLKRAGYKITKTT